MGDLQDKSREELEQMARDIPGVQSGMSKEELIQAIQQHRGGAGGQNPAAPGQGGGPGDTPPQSPNPEDWKNQPGNQS